jgi:hypothetical protein
MCLCVCVCVCVCILSDHRGAESRKSIKKTKFLCVFLEVCFELTKKGIVVSLHLLARMLNFLHYFMWSSIRYCLGTLTVKNANIPLCVLLEIPHIHFRCALEANDLERLLKEIRRKKYFPELPVQRNIWTVNIFRIWLEMTKIKEKYK